MLKARQILMYLAVKYDGDWDKIFDGIKRKEMVNEQDVNDIEANLNSEYCTILDNDYPTLLKNVYKPPFVLFYKGNWELTRHHSDILAVVGSREPSEYSAKCCRTIIQELNNRFIIVSGMALGIDGIAHRACIDGGGKTIVVLGSGINYPYPKSNKDIYDKCIKDHLVISEYAMDLKPQKDNFPIRNRIIVGLAWGVFIPEVKSRSGTMISIGHALNQNKEVLILPQPARNGTYNNHLIEEGACLVETGEHILDEKN